MIRRVSFSDLDRSEMEKVNIDPSTQIDDHFDYSKAIVKKPWGHEFLMYQNDLVAVWILSIKKGFQTSMHCHPSKKTSLVVLSGKAMCSTLHKKVECSPGDGLLIDKGVFHQTESLSEGGIFVMEIEMPVNKRDLIRLKDKYGRVGMGYESVGNVSYNLRNYNYISFIDHTMYYDMKKKFGTCSISLSRFKDDADFKMNFKMDGWDAICILKGRVLGNEGNALLDVGDTLDLEEMRRYDTICIDGELEVLTIKKQDSMVKASDYIASFFEREGISTVFLFPGSANVHLLDSIGKNTHLQYVSTQTEQAATIAAEGFAKLMGEASVAILPSGASCAQALAGVADAWVDSTPLLVISGQADQTTDNTALRQLGIQELDITSIAAPITKYAVKVDNPHMLRYHLEKALFLARHGRPGPVWVDIPIDILGMDINEEELVAFDPLEFRETRDESIVPDVARMLDMLKRSRKPVILAGNGIRLARAEEELLAFAETLGVPILTSRRGADLLPENHPLFFGRPGAYGQRSANLIIQNADLFVSIGSRLSLPQIGRNYKEFARNAKKVIIDIDPEELQKTTVKADLAICSSAKEFLHEVLRQIPSVQKPEVAAWIETCREWKHKYAREHISRMAGAVNAYAFFDALGSVLSENAILAIDGGAPMIFAMQAFQFKKGQRLLSATGLEHAGFALAASIGACAASEGKEIICIGEDHGFQKMNQELETIRTYHFPIKIFVLNSEGPAYIKKIQEAYFGRRFVASERKARQIDFGRVYEIPTFRIKSQHALEEDIRNVLNVPGPVICEIDINKNQEIVPRITFSVKPDGRWIARPLDEMYPFIDKKGLQEDREGMLPRIREGN